MVLENFVAPQGKAYELWALHGNTPKMLGRVASDARGHAVIRVENVGDPDDLSAFTISLEDAAAATSEPTGTIVMIGSLGS